MQLDQEPSVYEWQVLPFGTACSPRCATHTVHKQSFPSLIDKMRPLLADGGFEIGQWACNDPAIIHFLPPDAKSKPVNS